MTCTIVVFSFKQFFSFLHFQAVLYSADLLSLSLFIFILLLTYMYYLVLLVANFYPNIYVDYFFGQWNKALFLAHVICSACLMLYSLSLPSKANADEMKTIDGKPIDRFILLSCLVLGSTVVYPVLFHTFFLLVLNIC